MATSSTRRVTAAVCAASLAGTLAVLKAHDALTFSPYQAGDQSMAGMMHDAEGGNGADLGPGLFAAADSNTDGAVTRAEFKAALEKWFQDADKEKSGAVTEAELLAALKLPQPRLPLDSSHAGDARGAAGSAGGQAHAAAQGAGAEQVRRLHPHADSARGQDDRIVRQPDQGVVDDDHVRPGRHQRAEPEAVRRARPEQHHRGVPRRSERSGGHGRTQEGADRVSCAAARGSSESTAPATRTTRTARRRRRARVERVPAVEARAARSGADTDDAEPACRGTRTATRS